MNPKRRWLLSLLTLLVAVLIGQRSTAAPITVGYPQLSGGSMPLWVIAETHLDQRYGVDVKPIYIAGGAILTHSLIAGDVTIALTGGAVRLAEAPKRTLQLASVIGREFTRRLVDRLGEIRERTDDLLRELSALELIH